MADPEVGLGTIARVRRLPATAIRADDDGAGRAQLRDDRGISGDAASHQGQGTRRGLHPVRRRDVVLDQDRDAVERTANAPGTPLNVEGSRDPDRGRVGLDHRAEDRLQARDAGGRPS